MQESGNNAMKRSVADRPNNRTISDAIQLELKRAERYRIFVSLLAFDMGFAYDSQAGQSRVALTELEHIVRGHVRTIDQVSAVGDRKLVLLLPETSRQGAEVAARRVVHFLREHLAQKSEVLRDQVIPLEMASYPDAAGTRTIADLAQELKETEPI